MSVSRTDTLLCIITILCALPASAELTLEQLQQQLEQVQQQNLELRQDLGRLRDEVVQAREDAHAARAAAMAPSVAAGPETGLLDVPLGGGARFQLLDLSLDMLNTVGFSTVEDGFIEQLQAGGHDPRRRGFSLTNLELSFMAAIDPYLDGEVHLVYFIDPDGESRFELEEAFGRSRVLPLGLHELGLELEFGQMYTEFGRMNPVHPHAWTWLDQPVVSSRFFGEDGMRGPGIRLGWLLPVPWTSELHVGLQNAQGETMVSFLASDEVFEERPIGGRPFASAGNRSVSDLVTLVRWTNGFDLGDTWSGQWGASTVFGPNATGSGGRTWIYGADLVLKWVPLRSDRGTPFVTIEAELMGRRYEADSFFGCVEEECDEALSLGSTTLRDWGGYAQVLYGFKRVWSAGLRGEWATGSGDGDGLFASRSEDAFRDDRFRISPLLQWAPTEFSRLRLQYNYDRAEFLEERAAHSVWLGLELLLGSHPAHRF